MPQYYPRWITRRDGATLVVNSWEQHQAFVDYPIDETGKRIEDPAASPVETVPPPAETKAPEPVTPAAPDPPVKKGKKAPVADPLGMFKDISEEG